MHSILKMFIRRFWKAVTHVQVLSVFLAFSLMVLFSYNFMSGIVRRNMLNDVENAIASTQSQINIDLKEPEATLGIVAENIRNIIIQGYGADEVSHYLKYITDYTFSDDKFMSYALGFFGFFDVFGGIIIAGVDRELPENYVPQERPWYIAAVEANGTVGVTDPHLNIVTNNLNITFSRRIFDDNGNPYGIICLDIMPDRIRDYAVNTYGARGSYGILLDKDFNVIAHPHPAYIGRNVVLMNDGPAIREILERGESISERPATDYNGNESIIFVRQLDNGWYLAILTYSKDYYQNVNDLVFFLILLAFIFATALSAVLLSIVLQRKKAEERTMIMLDAAPLGVTMWDEDRNLIDFNYEAARSLGIYSKQEYRDKFAVTIPAFQSDGSKSIEKLDRFFTAAFKDGNSRINWEHNTVEGETIPFDAIAVRLRNEKKPVVIVYCRDMREINEALARVSEAEERTQIMLDATPLAANFWDKSFNNIDCNMEALKLFGLSNKEEYLDRFFELSPEYQPDGKKSAEKSNELVSKAFEEGYCSFEWLHRKLNGELIPCEVTLVRAKYKNENIVCGYTRDLRELKSIMTKMREADECTQVLFDTTPLSSFMMDNTFKLIECNQEIVRLFGIKDKQEFIDNLFDFFPEFQPSGEPSKEKMFRYIGEAFEDGYCRFEWTFRTLYGEQISTEVSLVRVKYRGVYAIAGYIKDLRELNAMIEEMRRAEIAEESSKAKSDFLAKMSHEIRTPMNAILGITEIQLQDTSLPFATKEALERIYNSGDMLLGIINDILDLSKIEAGKLELSCVQYDIASLIHDIVKLNMIRYESKPIEFKLDINENVPTLLYGDELRIKQILNNLLSNAYKYTQEGQIELSLYTEPVKDDSGVMVIFSVSDTGQGMTAEQVRKLGEKFSRFNLEANRKTEGTGLGMNITRNLIKLMDGNITVESTPGLGSTFTVSLPQKCIDPSPIGKELADNLMKLNMRSPTKTRNLQVKQEFMPYGSVLVVDDVETNLYVARGLLAPYGLSIDTSLSGFEAVDKIRGGSVYDIIFMDHMMPRMDGIEATKHIRSLGYTGPVVALTANAIAGQAEMFLSNGFDDFISKPIDIRQLNAVLNKLIRDKQPPEVIEDARKQKNNLYASGEHKIAVEPQLAEFFVRDAEKAVSILEAISSKNFRRADDISIFIINIHAMKSALANVGEGDLSKLAGKLEQAGREQNINMILSELPGFILSLRGVIDKFKPAEDTEEHHSDFEIDVPFLQEKLLAIQAACTSFDKKSAKDALAELKERTWPKPFRDHFSAISEHLLHSEFEEAAAVARKVYFT